MVRLKGFEMKRPATRGIFLCTMAAVLVVACGCGEQLTRMEENQLKLQAMITANARELATISSQIHTGTGKLDEGIQNLDADAREIAAGVQTVQDRQRQLQETVVAGNEGLDTKLTGLTEGQHSLDGRVAQVQDVTQRTASDLASLSQEHATLHETVQANHTEFRSRMGAVVSNQQGLQAGITHLQQADEGLARDIATVAGKQDALSSTMEENNRQAAEQLAALAGGQHRLAADLLNVRALVQAVATDVTGVADEQTALHAAMQSNAQTLADKLAIVDTNQQNHQAGLDRMAGTVNQTAALISAIATAQATMQETIAAGNEQVTTRLVSLTESQRNLQAGADSLDGKTDRLAADLAGATSSLQQTLSANHGSLTTQIAGLSESQQSLQSGLNAVNGKMDQATIDFSAAASSLQDSVRVSREVLTGQMAVSLQNQQAIQSSVEALGGRTERLAANLSQVSTDQTAAREMAKTNHDAVIAAMAGLSDDNQALRTGVDRIGTELTSVATEQKTLHETIRDNHDAAVARLGNLSRSQAELHGGMSTLNDRADAMTAELSAAAQRQDAVQRSIAAGNETLASRTTAIADGQQSLKTDIADLSAKTQKMAADVVAAATAQDAFQQMQKDHNQAVDVRTKDLAENQQTLRNQVDSLTATAGQTALAVLTMNNGQAAFQQAMQTGMNGMHERADQTAAGVSRMAEQQTALNESLATRAAALGENQQTMKADITRMANVVDRAYADLTAVSLAQDTLQSTLTSRSDEISGHVARVEGRQMALADNLNVLTATAGQTALDVIGLADGQVDLYKNIKTGDEAIIDRTTALAESHRALSGHLDTLTATAGQTALDIMSLTDDQGKLARTVQGGLTGLNEVTGRMADNQQQMQNGLNVLTATAGQTAMDVIDVSTQQDALQKTIRNHNASADSRMTKLAESQQQTLNGLNVLTATTGQTAIDVIDVSGRQDALQQTLQSHNESAGSRMAKLAENQQQMQSGLDTVTATTGQTTLDVLALNESQSRLARTTQAGHVETIGQLATIAQDQQRWLQRFDTAQARIQAMADGIATLDHQLGMLQEALQAGLQDTTTLVGTSGQQRQQFEAKIAQDVQAMIDAIAQLRQTQGQLQEQMSQVQKSTQSQADAFKAAIDQIKQPPAELKVSDAVQKVEPAVVQTGE